MKLFLSTLLVLTVQLCFAQKTIPQVLKLLNKKTVPYIKTDQIINSSDYVILDARESKEYNVSHIENAIPVGFDNFDLTTVSKLLPNKSSAIVVYCSIGVRSEIIGEKLKKSGYTNVSNLYGGIFDWKNNDRKVVNTSGIETDSIHTYNKKWSRYLKKGIKVYEN